MTLLELGQSASKCDTRIAHAMLYAVAVANLFGARWW